MTNRVTNPRITKLEKNEIFVFGSNLAGMHGGGAAAAAMKRFGAVWGQGSRPSGAVVCNSHNAGRGRNNQALC